MAWIRRWSGWNSFYTKNALFYKWKHDICSDFKGCVLSCINLIAAGQIKRLRLLTENDLNDCSQTFSTADLSLYGKNRGESYQQCPFSCLYPWHVRAESLWTQRFLKGGWDARLRLSEVERRRVRMDPHTHTHTHTHTHVCFCELWGLSIDFYYFYTDQTIFSIP